LATPGVLLREASPDNILTGYSINDASEHNGFQGQQAAVTKQIACMQIVGKPKGKSVQSMQSVQSVQSLRGPSGKTRLDCDESWRQEDVE
jgi:hypothetical protein